MEQEIVRRCKFAVASRSLAVFGMLKAQRNSCDAINESHAISEPKCRICLMLCEKGGY